MKGDSLTRTYHNESYIVISIKNIITFKSRLRLFKGNTYFAENYDWVRSLSPNEFSIPSITQPLRHWMRMFILRRSIWWKRTLLYSSNLQWMVLCCSICSYKE